MPCNTMRIGSTTEQLTSTPESDGILQPQAPAAVCRLNPDDALLP